MRIRATDRAGSPSESPIRFVSWSFRPQLVSDGQGVSPLEPDRQGAGAVGGFAAFMRPSIYPSPSAGFWWRLRNSVGLILQIRRKARFRFLPDSKPDSAAKLPRLSSPHGVRHNHDSLLPR